MDAFDESALDADSFEPMLTVFEEDPVGPEFTGVYDADGNPIFRFTMKNKIGFRLPPRDDEEDEYYEFE